MDNSLDQQRSESKYEQEFRPIPFAAMHLYDSGVSAPRHDALGGRGANLQMGSTTVECTF
jgi:hypothetical protein